MDLLFGDDGALRESAGTGLEADRERVETAVVRSRITVYAVVTRNIGMYCDVITDGGVEVAFEFAGIGPAFNAAVQSTRHGGTITVGSISDGEISTDLDDVVTTERTIKGTHCYGFPRPRSEASSTQ